MENQALTFESFLFDVPLGNRPFVTEMDAWLTERGCTRKLTMAKNGYVVSYNDGATKHALLNYVFRKKGMFARVYGDHVARDQAAIDAMSESVKASVKKSSNCKRLIDPAACSPHCKMGYQLTIDGEAHKKCRYHGFLLLLNEDSEETIAALIRHELAARLAP